MAHQKLFDNGLDPAKKISVDQKTRILDALEKEPPTEKLKELKEALEKLRHYTIRKKNRILTREQFKFQLAVYIKIVRRRVERIQQQMVKADPHKNKSREEVEEEIGLKLTEANEDVWGSRRQWVCAKAIARLLYTFNFTDVKLHPVFTMMLYPTGGIAGAGNECIYVGDLHEAIVLHATVHDAFGYMYNNHFKEGEGPGYNYTETFWTFRNKSSPMSCQLSGWYTAYKVLKKYNRHGNEGRLKRKERAKELARTLQNGNYDSPYSRLVIPNEREIDEEFDELERQRKSPESLMGRAMIFLDKLGWNGCALIGVAGFAIMHNII